MQRTDQSTLLEVSIVPGSPHQIRIHLLAVGFPLVGYPLHCVGSLPLLETKSVSGDCGYHLHAFRLGLRTQEPQSLLKSGVYCRMYYV